MAVRPKGVEIWVGIDRGSCVGVITFAVPGQLLGFFPSLAIVTAFPKCHLAAGVVRLRAGLCRAIDLPVAVVNVERTHVVVVV